MMTLFSKRPPVMDAIPKALTQVNAEVLRLADAARRVEAACRAKAKSEERISALSAPPDP